MQKEMSAVPIGKGIVVREGAGTAILNFGTLLDSAVTVANQLNSTVADMRFIKPIDKELIHSLAETHDLLVTLEENSIAGGAGSGVIEFLAAEGIVMPILQLGLPDKLIDHGTHAEQLVSINLDTASIQSAIVNRLKQLTLPSKVAQ